MLTSIIAFVIGGLMLGCIVIAAYFLWVANSSEEYIQKMAKEAQLDDTQTARTYSYIISFFFAISAVVLSLYF